VDIYVKKQTQIKNSFVYDLSKYEFCGRQTGSQERIETTVDCDSYDVLIYGYATEQDFFAFVDVLDEPAIALPTTHLITISLRANGTSSYRDAKSLRRLAGERGWTVSQLSDSRSATDATVVKTSADLLERLGQMVSDHSSKSSELLLVVSAHGYSGYSGPGRGHEADGRNEYISVHGQPVYDSQLRSALLDNLAASSRLTCIVDTCHSGTMLDFSVADLFPTSRLSVVCLSTCLDSELAGEDISSFGGWGGKLVAQFLDHCSHRKGPWCLDDVFDLYDHVKRVFQGQSMQACTPVLTGEYHHHTP